VTTATTASLATALATHWRRLAIRLLALRIELGPVDTRRDLYAVSGHGLADLLHSLTLGSLIRPHEQPPLTLMADHLPAPDGHSRVADKGIHRVSCLNACDLLCEPHPRSGQEWSASLYRRLLAASTGPVAVGIRTAAIRDRLETAGWFIAHEDGNLSEAREHCWPALPRVRRLGIGVGSPRPQIVLVGDRCTRHGQMPFASKSGTWLLLALRKLGYDELSVYLTNARTPRGARQTRQLEQLAEAFGTRDNGGPVWAALGNTADEVLKAAKIPHGKACHPQHHRQFKHHEDILGYAKRLRDAGLPEGPWIGGKLYTRHIDSIPLLGEPYSIRDLSNRGLPKPDVQAGVQQKTVDPVKRETARRAFITGEAPTITSAAKLAGLHVDQARVVARAEHWKAERDEHQRRVTEEVKTRAERQQAKDVADSLALAWKATKLGITDVVERLLAARGEPNALRKLAQKVEAGDEKATPLHPAPREVESLARVALALEGADIEGLSADGNRLANMPLQDLARETLRVMNEQFGE